MTAPTPICEPVSFWTVWTKTGHVPRKTHSTAADAEAEALRLAALHPGKKFIVLHAVSKLSYAAPTPPYPFCRTPAECAGKGYCPKEIACND